MKARSPLFTLFVFGMLGLLVLPAYAQPSWINYQRRQALYPDNQYVSGFAAEIRVDVPTTELEDRLISNARKELIESIQVQIRSVSTTQTEIVNTATREYFQNTSVSLAEANIVGLKDDFYHDPKKKEAYAFVYADRRELIEYHKKFIFNKKDEIANKVRDARTFASQGDKENALKSYFECTPIFLELQKAQSILIALDTRSEQYLYIDEINDLQQQVTSGISGLLNSDNLTIDEAAYFLAYGLKLQVEAPGSAIALQPLEYQDTEMLSEFSARFKDIFAQNLVNESQYNLRNAAPNNEGYHISGTYWENGDLLKLIANLNHDGETVASVETAIPISYLDAKNIDFIPEDLRKIELLPDIILRSTYPQMEVKVMQAPKRPLEVVGTTSNGPLVNAPILYTYAKTGERIQSIKTDRNGKARAYLGKVSTKDKILVVQAELDLEAYLGIDRASAFYQKIVQAYAIPKTKVILRVTPLEIYITTVEYNMGQDMMTHIIEPKLKEALAENGYAFSKDMGGAEYAIEIKAEARQGTSYNGLHFSFVDANVSVLDLNTGDEVYKNAYTNIKGGGGDFRQAGVKAYQAAAKKIVNEILNEILN